MGSNEILRSRKIKAQKKFPMEISIAAQHEQVAVTCLHRYFRYDSGVSDDASRTIQPELESHPQPSVIRGKSLTQVTLVRVQSAAHLRMELRNPPEVRSLCGSAGRMILRELRPEGWLFSGALEWIIEHLSHRRKPFRHSKALKLGQTMASLSLWRKIKEKFLGTESGLYH
ncbi:hypothetical protein RvY_14399 [Ramazzottius varieornatus]|uniref:Uncharacterized protein n=1 Tax=Ramazzottius varieornatus TaxID=947166 RepID=A0A1D1VSW5_RAMVA|nr:hypothetical protein RvY_14399 [Ramazzottius varieornatus]